MSGLLEIRDLRKAFPLERGLTRRERGRVLAVDGADLVIERGTTTGLVGESGSGKSTLARLVLRLVEPTTGEVLLDARNLTNLGRRELRAARRDMQMVFQDPLSSLDPTANVLASLAEPLRLHLKMDRAARRRRAAELLELVGLPAAYLERYPAESRVASSNASRSAGGVGGAEARDPRRSRQLTGRVDPGGGHQPPRRAPDHPQHLVPLHLPRSLGRPARQPPDRGDVPRPDRRRGSRRGCLRASPPSVHPGAALRDPVPNPERQRARQRIVLAGDVPSASDPPSGCHFHTRCPHVMDVCREVDPPEFEADDGTRVFCHLHREGPALAGASVAELPPPRRTDAGQHRGAIGPDRAD